ncbi:MAG: DUF1631 domain-containing protein [Gammaproteobacteria bacterium]|nr:DUF1631 domain-containing protein [Gammaproteobacteria bacterium]
MSKDDDDLVQCNAADFFFDGLQPKTNTNASGASKTYTKATPPRELFIRALQEYLALLQNDQEKPSPDHLVNTLNLMQTKIRFLGMDDKVQRNIHGSTAVIDDFTAILHAACRGAIDPGYLEAIKIVRDKFNEQFRKNLPQQANMLLAELQVPFLKLAFIDKSLLLKATFAGNTLVTVIAHTATAIAAEKLRHDSVYQECYSVVQHILANFENDTTLFTRLMKTSEILQKQMAPGAESIDPPAKSNVIKVFPPLKPKADISVRQDNREIQAAKDKLDGPDKSVQAPVPVPALPVLSKSEELINYVLDKNQKGKKLPAEVARFFNDTWKQVLHTSLEKYGESSTAYRRTVELVENLAWITDLQLNMQDAKTIKQIYAEIWVRLDEGLREIDIDQSRKEDICKVVLDLFHEKIVS